MRVLLPCESSNRKKSNNTDTDSDHCEISENSSIVENTFIENYKSNESGDSIGGSTFVLKTPVRQSSESSSQKKVLSSKVIELSSPNHKLTRKSVPAIRSGSVIPKESIATSADAENTSELCKIPLRIQGDSKNTSEQLHYPTEPTFLIENTHVDSVQVPYPIGGNFEEDCKASVSDKTYSSSHLEHKTNKRSLLTSKVDETANITQINSAIVSTSAANCRSKRPRNDSNTTKKASEVPADFSMAIGLRRKADSDDESTYTNAQQQQPPRRYWVQPAENEPPRFGQNHTMREYTCPVDSEDDARDLPQQTALETVAKVADVVAVLTDDETTLVQFSDDLKKVGLEMVIQNGDGNCLFRAVSLQVYGSPDNHGEVRKLCMDYMAQNEEHFSNFVAAASDDELTIPLTNRSESAFQAYISRKRMNGVHGNHTEIQALSELFNRPVEVYTPATSSGENSQLKPMNIFHKEYKTNDPPIRLSYHDGNHYNAIIDPLVPTAGLGLGLPDLIPGLADKMQVTKAKAESDQLADEMELARVLKESQNDILLNKDDELERVLKESSRDFLYEQKVMALSDLDETNFELEQKVLASSMESYFRQEHGRKQRATVPNVSSSSSRRKRGSPQPQEYTDTHHVNSYATATSENVATMAIPLPNLNARNTTSTSTTNQSVDDEYPQVVQELVMNGFDLQDVVRAYEFVGDRFDDLLSFLLNLKKS